MAKPIIICKECGEEKHHHAKGMCMACYGNVWARANRESRTASHRKWVRKNREKLNAYQRDWDRNNPEKKQAQRRRHRARHRDKINQRNKEWRLANREKHIQNALDWRKNNPEKSRKVIRRASQLYRARQTSTLATLTKQEWKDILDHFDHRCAYCNRQLKRLTQEHFIPLSAGGGYTKGNIIPACRSCNSTKNDKSFEDFASYMEEIGKPLNLLPPMLDFLQKRGRG